MAIPVWLYNLANAASAAVAFANNVNGALALYERFEKLQRDEFHGMGTGRRDLSNPIPGYTPQMGYATTGTDALYAQSRTNVRSNQTYMMSASPSDYPAAPPTNKSGSGNPMDNEWQLSVPFDRGRMDEQLAAINGGNTGPLMASELTLEKVIATELSVEKLAVGEFAIGNLVLKEASEGIDPLDERIMRPGTETELEIDLSPRHQTSLNPTLQPAVPVPPLPPLGGDSHNLAAELNELAEALKNTPVGKLRDFASAVEEFADTVKGLQSLPETLEPLQALNVGPLQDFSVGISGAAGDIQNKLAPMASVLGGVIGTWIIGTDTLTTAISAAKWFSGLFGSGPSKVDNLRSSFHKAFEASERAARSIERFSDSLDAKTHKDLLDLQQAGSMLDRIVNTMLSADLAEVEAVFKEDRDRVNARGNATGAIGLEEGRILSKLSKVQSNKKGIGTLLSLVFAKDTSADMDQLLLDFLAPKLGFGDNREQIIDEIERVRAEFSQVDILRKGKKKSGKVDIRKKEDYEFIQDILAPLDDQLGLFGQIDTRSVSGAISEFTFEKGIAQPATSEQLVALFNSAFEDIGRVDDESLLVQALEEFSDRPDEIDILKTIGKGFNIDSHVAEDLTTGERADLNKALVDLARELSVMSPTGDGQGSQALTKQEAAHASMEAAQRPRSNGQQFYAAKIPDINLNRYVVDAGEVITLNRSDWADYGVSRWDDMVDFTEDLPQHEFGWYEAIDMLRSNLTEFGVSRWADMIYLKRGEGRLGRHPRGWHQVLAMSRSDLTDFGVDSWSDMIYLARDEGRLVRHPRDWHEVIDVSQSDLTDFGVDSWSDMIYLARDEGRLVRHPRGWHEVIDVSQSDLTDFGVDSWSDMIYLARDEGRLVRHPRDWHEVIEMKEKIAVTSYDQIIALGEENEGLGRISLSFAQAFAFNPYQITEYAQLFTLSNGEGSASQSGPKRIDLSGEQVVDLSSISIDTARFNLSPDKLVRLPTGYDFRSFYHQNLDSAHITMGLKDAVSNAFSKGGFQVALSASDLVAPISIPLNEVVNITGSGEELRFDLDFEFLNQFNLIRTIPAQMDLGTIINIDASQGMELDFEFLRGFGLINTIPAKLKLEDIVDLDGADVREQIVEIVKRALRDRQL